MCVCVCVLPLQVWGLSASAGLQGRSWWKSLQRSQFSPTVLCLHTQRPCIWPITTQSYHTFCFNKHFTPPNPTKNSEEFWLLRIITIGREGTLRTWAGAQGRLCFKLEGQIPQQEWDGEVWSSYQSLVISYHPCETKWKFTSLFLCCPSEAWDGKFWILSVALQNENQQCKPTMPLSLAPTPGTGAHSEAWP